MQVLPDSSIRHRPIDGEDWSTRWPSSALATVALPTKWLQRHRYRSNLRRLLEAGPHLIPDIGLSTEEALFEICKPFWRE